MIDSFYRSFLIPVDNWTVFNFNLDYEHDFIYNFLLFFMDSVVKKDNSLMDIPCKIEVSHHFNLKK